MTLKENVFVNNINNIALIGSASYEFITGGTGSGDVDEAYSVSLDEALKNNGYKLNKVSSQRQLT